MSDVGHELKSLRLRISRLQEVFNSLPLNPPGPEEWPFWLEKFNALSGLFTSLERESLASSGLLMEHLIEPTLVPTNPAVPVDSIPNILLRSKLAPEVIEAAVSHLERKESVAATSPPSEVRIKVYQTMVKGLQERFSEVQGEFQAAMAEQTSALLAEQMIGGSARGSRTSSRNASADSINSKVEVQRNHPTAVLESSVRLLYTGKS